MVIRR